MVSCNTPRLAHHFSILGEQVVNVPRIVEVGELYGRGILQFLLVVSGCPAAVSGHVVRCSVSVQINMRYGYILAYIL